MSFTSQKQLVVNSRNLDIKGWMNPRIDISESLTPIAKRPIMTSPMTGSLQELNDIHLQGHSSGKVHHIAAM
jgi:hypothetical protein